MPKFVYATSEDCSACEQVRKFLVDKFAVDVAVHFENVDRTATLGRTGIVELDDDGAVIRNYKSPHEIATFLQVLGHIDAGVPINPNLTFEFLQSLSLT